MAVLVRLRGIDNGWLWGDEVLSAVLAYNSPVDVVLSVLRFDFHLPFYYLQLWAWLRLGTSDTWIMLNSVAWSLLGALSLYWVGRRIANGYVAVTAAALFATMPAAVLYGYEARMYIVVMTMIVWAWYFNHALVSGTRGAARWAGLIAAEFAIVYSHGAGLAMLLGVCAYAFAGLVARRDWATFRRWIVAQAVVGLASLPAVIIALTRRPGHAIAPDVGDMIHTISFLLFGPLVSGTGWAFLLVGVLFAGLVAAASRDRLLRRLFGWAILLPLVAIATVSLLGKPIWLGRTISFIVPLLCLAISLAIWSARPRPVHTIGAGRILASAILVGSLAALSLWGVVVHRKGDGFRPVAEMLRAQARPGDVVYVGGTAYDFWCLAWYFAGPGQVAPLRFHDVSPRWRRFYDQLGPAWLRRLHLDSQENEVEVRGVRLIAGAIAPMPESAGGRTFQVEVQPDEPHLAIFAGRLHPSVPITANLVVHVIDAERTRQIR
jgi:hypothetical protein